VPELRLIEPGRQASFAKETGRKLIIKKGDETIVFEDHNYLGGDSTVLRNGIPGPADYFIKDLKNVIHERLVNRKRTGAMM